MAWKLEIKNRSHRAPQSLPDFITLKLYNIQPWLNQALEIPAGTPLFFLLNLSFYSCCSERQKVMGLMMDENMLAGGWLRIQTLDGRLLPGDFPCSRLQRGDPRTVRPNSSLHYTTIYPPRSALKQTSWFVVPCAHVERKGLNAKVTSTRHLKALLLQDWKAASVPCWSMMEDGGKKGLDVCP